LINGKKCLGVIPARGGSKRVKRKNIRLLAGKPLIQWTIEAGLKSNAIDNLIISTDDIQIAEIAKKCGGDVPFIRPKKLATDSSNSYEVLNHAYETLKKQGDDYSYIMMLQPTSPLRTSFHIDNASAFLEKKRADGVIGVTQLNHPLEWTNTLTPSFEMDSFIDDYDVSKQSQNFPKRYTLNGAIYITNIDRMNLEKSHIYGRSMYAFVMDEQDSIDIDTEFDFEIADYLMSKRIE
jgi:CMP-N,N'-diacetyllegionaminic acid synthase